MYILNLKDTDLIMTPSSPYLLIFRIIEISLFFDVLGICIVFYNKLLTRRLNLLIVFWFIGSIALFPAWYLWGGIYGFILRTVQTIIFPASILITNMIEQKTNLNKISGKVFVIIVAVILIIPTIYSFSIMNTLSKGSISEGEYYGLRWINFNINSDQNIYSDLRIAGGIVPITNYTHIQLKGPNDANGMDTITDGVNFKKELLNLWYIDKISPYALKVLQQENINYIVHSSSYFDQGLSTSNFNYKPLPESTNKAFDTSGYFNKVYSDGNISIYKVNHSVLQDAPKDLKMDEPKKEDPLPIASLICPKE
jgi:hypothetical protein